MIVDKSKDAISSSQNEWVHDSLGNLRSQICAFSLRVKDECNGYQLVSYNFEQFYQILSLYVLKSNQFVKSNIWSIEVLKLYKWAHSVLPASQTIIMKSLIFKINLTSESQLSTTVEFSKAHFSFIPMSKYQKLHSQTASPVSFPFTLKTMILKSSSGTLAKLTKSFKRKDTPPFTAKWLVLSDLPKNNTW